MKGEWGAEIVDDLAPHEGRIVVEGKRGLDTFASTKLNFMLRSKCIKTIVLGGFLTNCCVESTMRSGYENGDEVCTLTDCTAATSPEEHDNALEGDRGAFRVILVIAQSVRRAFHDVLDVVSQGIASPRRSLPTLLEERQEVLCQVRIHRPMVPVR